jgi:hypothetical protein
MHPRLRADCRAKLLALLRQITEPAGVMLTEVEQSCLRHTFSSPDHDLALTGIRAAQYLGDNRTAKYLLDIAQRTHDRSLGDVALFAGNALQAELARRSASRILCRSVNDGGLDNLVRPFGVGDTQPKPKGPNPESADPDIPSDAD